MREVEPITLAYLAGMVDADGYITIHRSNHRSTRSGRSYYGAKIGIAGCRREPHDLASSIFGGKVSCYTPKNSLHLPQFQWSRCGKAAVVVIAALLPFLRIKIEQAHKALEIDEHIEFGRGDDPYPWFGPDYDPAPKSEELYMEAKDLNLRKPRGRKKRDGVEYNEMPETRP